MVRSAAAPDPHPSCPPPCRCVRDGKLVTQPGYVSVVLERVATSQGLYARSGLVTLSGVDGQGKVRWVRTCAAGPAPLRKLDPSDPSNPRWFASAPCQHFIGFRAASLTTRVTLKYIV